MSDIQIINDNLELILNQLEDLLKKQQEFNNSFETLIKDFNDNIISIDVYEEKLKELFEKQEKEENEYNKLKQRFNREKEKIENLQVT